MTPASLPDVSPCYDHVRLVRTETECVISSAKCVSRKPFEALSTDSKSKSSWNWQSVSTSWCRAPLGFMTVAFWSIEADHCSHIRPGASVAREWVCLVSSLSFFVKHIYLYAYMLTGLNLWYIVDSRHTKDLCQFRIWRSCLSALIGRKKCGSRWWSHFGFLHVVVAKYSNVSKEDIVSIFRITELISVDTSVIRRKMFVGGGELFVVHVVSLVACKEEGKWASFSVQCCRMSETAFICLMVSSRVQKFPAWHTKAAPNGKCCEGYIVPSMVRLMYQLKSVLK